MTFEVCLSLGSNITPEEHLRKAVNRFSEVYNLTAISPIYRTRPVNMRCDAEVFHNLCVIIRTDLRPADLKHEMNRLERSCGRIRSSSSPEDEHFSRRLDVDILLYHPRPEDFSPHPQIWKEAFVVYPLSDLIAPPALEGIPASVEEWRKQTDADVILGKVDYGWPRNIRSKQRCHRA